MSRQSESLIHQSESDPVVITGLGAVTPLAANLRDTWTRLLAGETSARWLTDADVPSLSACSDHRRSQWIGSPAALPRQDGSDRVIELARSATREAWTDSGLEVCSLDTTRLGCVFATSKGSLFAATDCLTNPDPIDDTANHAWQDVLAGPALAVQAISREYGALGPGLCPVAACASGLAAVIRAAQLIQSGECDVVIAGSADDSLHPLVLASFQRLGVLASHENPARASRPFDRDRNGFVIGAGAGSLILERRSHARSRRHTWYAELGSGHLRSDPTGMTSLDVSGELLGRLVIDCQPLDSRGIGQTPDVINLHGTATRLNDAAECRALRRVFGDRLESVTCGSLKGSLGHLLGAAGSVELALCCLMLRDQLVPPNVNLDHADPECNLPWRCTALSRPVESLLKLSLGFGGHQAGLWVQRGSRSPEFTASQTPIRQGDRP